MKILLIVSLLFLLSHFSRAQFLQLELDSLLHKLQIVKNDTLRMNAYIELGSIYDDVNLDSSVYYCNKAIEITNKLQLKFDEVIMSVRQCWPLGKMGNYPLAFKQLNNGLDFFSNPSNEKYIYNIPPGQTAETVRLLWLGYTYAALGGLYAYAGNDEKSMIPYQQSIQIAQSIKDYGGLADSYSGISEAYFNLEKIDSALYYCQKSLQLYEKDAYKKYLPFVIIQMGEIKNHQGDTGLAKQYFNKAIQASILYKNPVQKGEAHTWLARIYQSENKIDSALYHAKEAVAVFKLSGKEKSAAIAYRLASDFYGMLGKADSSFLNLKYATELNDRLTKAEKEKLQQFQAAGFEEIQKAQLLEKEKIRSKNKNRIVLFSILLSVAFTLAFIFYQIQRKEKNAKLLLEQKNHIIEKTLNELKSTQAQLIQSEKMASLGELTAGIAHEIQNPLNFVNNFSEVSNELIDEMNNELNNGDIEEAKVISSDLKQNLEKINQHGQRASSIVKGMLEHSRTSSGEKVLTDINALCDEYLRLAYQSIRSKDKSFQCEYTLDLDPTLPKINIVAQDISRVVLNILNNAFQAVGSRANRTDSTYTNSLSNPARPVGGLQGYQPLVSIKTKYVASLRRCEISISDNGTGIPDSIKDKIFQPFFTTKPTGQGTGLGLSLSYDIVKAHGGELKVETKEGEGSIFTIKIPMA